MQKICMPALLEHRKLLLLPVGNISHLAAIHTMERPMIRSLCQWSGYKAHFFGIIFQVTPCHLRNSASFLFRFSMHSIMPTEQYDSTGYFAATIVRLHSGKYPLYSNPSISRDRATLQKLSASGWLAVCMMSKSMSDIRAR